MPKYSLCESVTATSASPWCIRPLTSEGQKFTGGVDTPSLCGHVQPPHGWDLDVKFNAGHRFACNRCVKLLHLNQKNQGARR